MAGCERWDGIMLGTRRRGICPLPNFPGQCRFLLVVLSSSAVLLLNASEIWRRKRGNSSVYYLARSRGGADVVVTSFWKLHGPRAWNILTMNTQYSDV